MQNVTLTYNVEVVKLQTYVNLRIHFTSLHCVVLPVSRIPFFAHIRSYKWHVFNGLSCNLRIFLKSSDPTAPKSSSNKLFSNLNH